VVAVWNRTQSKAVAFAKDFGGKVYETAEEAIDAPEVEGVYVNVNNDMHETYTCLAIEKGKPVLCEKPFAVIEKAAKAIFDYAREKDVYVAEAMWTWHNDTALKVKEWIESGVLGDLESVSSAFEVPLVNGSTNPRLTTPAMLGGALMDLGVYNVRYCYELFGLPEQIDCEARMEAVDYSETITFDYPGFKAINLVSMEKDGGHYFEIKGTKGSIYVPQFHMAKTATLKTEDKEETFEVDDLLYGKQFSNVAAEIRAGKKEGEKISAKSTIEVMALLDECRSQMGLVYPQEKQNDEA
ncbi:MAG: Gfo/Idh/MocA family oxidoreductase, partial [Alkalibacterium sp.]